MLTIDFLYPVERPLADEDFEAGAGGSENLVILLSRALAGRGHEVRVWCHARRPGVHNGVRWRPIERWPRERERDLTIAFRDPAPLWPPAASRLRVLLLADRRMPGIGRALDRGGIDLVVAVSRFQQEEVARAEGVAPDRRWVVLPSFGTRMADYRAGRTVKEPGLCHYTSAPYRGLAPLLDLWPRIRERVPHARLVVSSSYLHWGHSAERNQALAGELYARMASMGGQGVVNVTRLGRRALVDLQLRSELLLYPATYDETYCVAALEAAAAGAVVVATRRGALVDRVVDGQTGFLVVPSAPDWGERFVERAVLLLGDHRLRERMGAAARRFTAGSDYDDVARRWELLWARALAPSQFSAGARDG